MEKDAEFAPIYFTIVGTGLDIDGISQSLGMSPTHSHRVGDVDTLGRPFQHDMWSLQSELPETEPPDTHLKSLRQKLQPHYDFITSLKSKAEIHIYCGYNCESEQDGFILSAESLMIFTELGIPMELHVLF